MPENQPNAVEVSQQLGRMLASPVFAGAQRRSRFLRYAVERALQGQGGEVKEYSVALDVFDRQAGFDPSTDSIVRVEAGKLRATIEKYYATDGLKDPVVISIPKGGYTASFRLNDLPAEEKASSVSVRSWGTTIATWAAIAMLVFTAGFAISRRVPGSETASAGGTRTNSIAVLPFKSLSSEKADEYFADGLTDQLIHSLGMLRDRRVIAPTSVMQFRNQARDIRKIGQMLNAGVVIEGSVRRMDDKVRISVEASDAASGQQMWSRSYDRPLQDLATAQGEVARDIANSLFPHAVALDEAVLAWRKPTNQEAYQYYLRGMVGDDRNTREGLEASIEDLRFAIAADPQYAPAYSSLADSYVALSIYSFWPPHQAAPEARRNAERAAALDPSIGDPHADVGFVAATYDWNPAEAEREFRRSIELNPSCAHCRAWYALYTLAPAGRYEEARQQVIQAEAADPLSPGWPSFEIAVAVYSGHLAEALEQGQRIATPGNRDFRAHAAYASALRKAGRLEEAVTEARRAVEFSGNHPLALRVLGATLGAAGHRQEALAVIDSLQQDARSRYVSPAAIAVIHYSVGDRREFLEWLGKAVETHDPTLIFLRAWVDPKTDTDPRLQALLAKVVIFR